LQKLNGGSHSSVEDALLLGYYIVLIDRWLQTVDEGVAVLRNISHYLPVNMA
jgi:hypothetical protein